MEPETLVHRLQKHYAFSQANDASLLRLAEMGTPLNAAPRQKIADPHEHTEYLYLLLEGNAEIHDADQELTLRLQADSLTGYGTRSSLHGTAWTTTGISSTIWLKWSSKEIDLLCQTEPAMGFYLSHRKPEAIEAPPIGTRQATSNWLSAPVRTLLRSGEAICIQQEASVRDAAILMSERQVSAVLILDQSRLLGIVTDKDLRNRVVSTGLNIQSPVSAIATLQPRTLSAGDKGFDAIMLMAQQHIHHIPILEEGLPIGVLCANDLSEQRQASAIFLVKNIQKQSTTEGLCQVVSEVGRLQLTLALQGASALIIGKMVTAITDALTKRLLTLAHTKFGPAPIPYLWVAAGSQAREEQSAKTDQDNCMILDDAYSASEHGAYFEQFSRWVCDGLDACGYIHCPGEMMAMTAQWRQPLKQWRAYFERWIRTPDPKALMLTCVFFDMRAIEGDFTLLQSLRAAVLEATRKNSLFLAHMVGIALKHQPPLGLFGQLTFSRNQENLRKIDLKHGGTVPIIDLARIYALAGGSHAVNTDERLIHASEGGEISEDKTRDLREALELIAGMRIDHQTRQVSAGLRPDNYLEINELSHLERSFLKEAFGVVKGLQSVLEQRYGGRN